MSHHKLTDFVEATATELGIPGVAVGVWVGGQEFYACHGVTSADNPLPVDQDTLYQPMDDLSPYLAPTGR